MGALTELVSKARKGNADARAELEEHLRPLVHGVLLAWLPHALAGLQVRGLITDSFGAILSEDQKFVPTLLSRVRASGKLKELVRKPGEDPPSLEDVFLRLTGKKLEEADQEATPS